MIRKKPIFYVCIIFFAAFSYVIHADDVLFPNKKWNFGLAGKTDYAGLVQLDKSGTKNNFDPALTLMGGMQFQLPYSFYPYFEAGSTIPGEGRDPNITRLTWFIDAGTHWRFDLGSPDAFGIKAGLGMSMMTISGNGGEQTLRNGNSTESFPLPSGTTTTRNVVALTGINYEFLDNWRVGFDFHFFNLFNQFNNATSYLFYLNYCFGLGGKQDNSSAAEVEKRPKNYLQPDL